VARVCVWQNLSALRVAVGGQDYLSFGSLAIALHTTLSGELVLIRMSHPLVALLA